MTATDTYQRRAPSLVVGSLQRFARELLCPLCRRGCYSLGPDHPLTPTPISPAIAQEERHVYWRCEQQHDVHTRAVPTITGWRLDSWPM